MNHISGEFMRAQVQSLACLVKSQLLQGGKTLNDAAATYHLFVYYMLMC